MAFFLVWLAPLFIFRYSMACAFVFSRVFVCLFTRTAWVLCLKPEQEVVWMRSVLLLCSLYLEIWEGGQVFLCAGPERNNGILEKAPSLDLLFPVTVFTSFSSIRLKGCRYQVYKYLFFLPSNGLCFWPIRFFPRALSVWYKKHIRTFAHLNRKNKMHLFSWCCFQQYTV